MLKRHATRRHYIHKHRKQPFFLKSTKHIISKFSKNLHHLVPTKYFRFWKHWYKKIERFR